MAAPYTTRYSHTKPARGVSRPRRQRDRATAKAAPIHVPANIFSTNSPPRMVITPSTLWRKAWSTIISPPCTTKRAAPSTPPSPKPEEAKKYARISGRLSYPRLVKGKANCTAPTAAGKTSTGHMPPTRARTPRTLRVPASRHRRISAAQVMPTATGTTMVRLQKMPSSAKTAPCPTLSAREKPRSERRRKTKNSQHPTPKLTP